MLEDFQKRYVYYIFLYLLGGCLAIYSIEIFSVMIGGITCAIALKTIFKQIKENGIRCLNKLVVWIIIVGIVCFGSYFLLSVLKEVLMGGVFSI